MLADLLFLPVLMASVRFVTLWDLLTLRLGRAPERTIPLFHGLSASQARLVLLTGALRSVSAGQRIVTHGDPGDGMYVMVSGRAEVEVSGPDGRVVVASLGRGTVIGEMGLLRHEARSADVVATESTEILVVNETFFDVLLRRNPRVAGIVLMNLARILSDRVQSLTERLFERSVKGPILARGAG